VRVDSALYAGAVVPPFYDSLIAKLVIFDDNREACLARAKRAIAEYVIAGLPTNLPLIQAVLEHEAFATNAYHTAWLTSFLVEWQARD
jgi:acetyl-CoA carboxylase biotin carboxylase subunit